MTTNLFQRIDTTKIYKPFMVKIEQLVKNCQARGVDYWAISGLRTWVEQDALYAQGRTKEGKIVTNAKGGQSYHNFAIAVDFCPDKDMTREGLQPDWNTEAYKILAEEAVKLGLEPGFYWKFKDAPHVQLKISNAGLSLADLQKAHGQPGKGKGLVDVFELLDKHAW